MKSTAVDILVIWDGECLSLALPGDSTYLDMAAPLRKRLETKIRQYPQHFVSGQGPQLRHQATASSSMVASTVGLLAIPNEARSSPSK